MHPLTYVIDRNTIDTVAKPSSRSDKPSLVGRLNEKYSYYFIFLDKAAAPTMLANGIRLARLIHE